MKSGFYGFIPTNIRHHKDLKANAKLVYAEITACLNADGVCTSPNIYFSKALQVTKATVSSCLTDLRKLGYINVVMELEEGTHRFIMRYITLTPSNQLGGGVTNEGKTPTGNFDGGQLSVPLESASTPSNELDTLIDNNINDINTIYTTGHQDALNRSITDVQLKYLKGIVAHFLDIQSKRHPNMISINWRKDKHLINGSINTLYDLIRLDKFDHEIIKKTISWALDDKFWADNVLSLKNLRHLSRSGFSKFQNINHSYLKKVKS